MKKFIYLFIAVIYIIGFIVLISNSDNEQKKSQSNEKSKSEISIKKELTLEEKKARAIDLYFSKLYKDFSELSYLQKDDYYPDVDFVIERADLFRDIALRINDAIGFGNDSLTNTAKRLKKQLITAQVRDFPVMRKEYIKIASKKLWENNIKVNGSNRSITFTGGIFANNKNKKEMFDNLQHIFLKLRFDNVNFKWYKYDNEYTIYRLASKKDSEI